MNPLKWFTGDKPDITPAQIIAGIPLIANLLAAWGVWAPNIHQQETLRDTIQWAFGLLAADAIVRTGRNIAAKKATH